MTQSLQTVVQLPMLAFIKCGQRCHGVLAAMELCASILGGFPLVFDLAVAAAFNAWLRTTL
jgi:hypothetical protein